MTSNGRIVAGYRAAAVLLLNAVLFLVGLELAATAVLATAAVPLVRSMAARVIGRPVDVVSHYESLSYYSQRDWSARYWDEFQRALTTRYQAHVTWRSAPFSGDTINIDEDGVRRTPGAECGPGAYTVFALGGSAMWGWGAPDWATIPAYLQQGLRARRGGAVCVVNLGENAYVATQGLIQLLRVLASGRVPDAVIMYDGVNDVLAAHQTGRPGLHQNYAEISGVFHGTRHPWREWMQRLRSYELISAALSHAARPSTADTSRAVDVEALADGIVSQYLSTYRAVGALASAYGFDYYSFWQPHILTGSKPLADEERRLIDGLNWALVLDSTLVALFNETYAGIARAAPGGEHLHSLAHAFDTVEAPIWIDTWGHVTPAGNRVVAELMLRAMP